MNHPSDEDLVLFHYRERADASAMADHIEHCAECQVNLRALERTLAAVDGHGVPELPDDYNARVWARLEPRLEAPRATWWQSWFAPRQLALAASVALLLVAAFVAGRYSSRPAAPTAAPPQASNAKTASEPTSTAAQIRDRVLMVAVGEHLEKSQIVLIELMNAPTHGSVDITATQEWARDLVPANRLIRQTADDTGETGVADVLGDLERTLVEIANSPSRLSATELQRIRERVEADGLVFKIRVLDSQVQGREKAAAAGTRARS